MKLLVKYKIKWVVFRFLLPVRYKFYNDHRAFVVVKICGKKEEQIYKKFSLYFVNLTIHIVMPWSRKDE